MTGKRILTPDCTCVIQMLLSRRLPLRNVGRGPWNIPIGFRRWSVSGNAEPLPGPFLISPPLDFSSSPAQTMQDLPHEILDEILGHLPPADTRTFRNCSLVAKSWTRPSRRLLFRLIDTLKEPTLWSWLEDVSPRNVELLQHVHSLSVRVENSLHRSSVAPTGFPHDRSPLFPCLRRLSLHSGSPASIAKLGVSLASQRTLEFLCLSSCHVTISTLATLINHFPNLVHLKLLDLVHPKPLNPYHDVDNELTPPLSRPLRQLTVNEPGTCDEPGILDQLLGLQPQCEEVTISVSPFVAQSLTQRIINGIEATIKRLDLNFRMKCKYRHREENLSWELLNEAL